MPTNVVVIGLDSAPPELIEPWVAQGKLNTWVGMLSPHLLMLLAVLVLFYLRTRLRPLRWRRA